MTSGWRFADLGKLALSATATVVLVLGLLTACTSGGGGSGCVQYGVGTDYDFTDSVTVGFDDSSSAGAILTVAIDTDTDTALVIALRFPNSVVNLSRAFSPTCDTTTAIDSYTYGVTNSVTLATSTSNPYLTEALTDTTGILGMDHTMNALLIIDDTTMADEDRYFLAVSGSITAVRDDPSDPSVVIVTGDLTFVEIDGLSVTADIEVGGALLRIDDINFSVDTTVQPM